MESSSAPSSTVTTSEATAASPPASAILEISLISAQDLAPVSKCMKTYAVAWIHPSRKMTSRLDQQGNTNPLWNDRFAFRVDQDFLSSEKSAVAIEIYSSCWLKDILVGTVKVLISDLVSPNTINSTRYVALQIRRSSGDPQGILNMGVTLIHAPDKSLHLNKTFISLKKNIQPHGENETTSYSEFIEDFPEKAGSVYNGSELWSDVGPSASIVAAEMSRKSTLPTKRSENDVDWDDLSHSIVGEMTIEEATAKGFKPSARKLRKEVSLPSNCGEEGGIGRRHSDGGAFSCFGGAMGIEISVVCGASKGKARSKRRYIGSEANSY